MNQTLAGLEQLRIQSIFCLLLFKLNSDHAQADDAHGVVDKVHFT